MKMILTILNKSMAVFDGLYFYRLYNDIKKCSKLKWNHRPQSSGFSGKPIGAREFEQLL